MPYIYAQKMKGSYESHKPRQPGLQIELKNLSFYFLFHSKVTMSTITPSKTAAIHAYRHLLKTQKQVFASKYKIELVGT
jgi:hypothetical protein